jgi:hypothetical protein
MNVLRWIFFFPTALASGLLAKLAWDVSNKLFLRFEPGVLGQWMLWGTGEVICILVFFYVAIRIVPTRKRTVAYALCGLGIVLGLLTTGYLVYLFLTLGIHSEDPSFLQDIIQGLVREVIETSTAVILLVYIQKGKLEHWLQIPTSEKK